MGERIIRLDLIGKLTKAADIQSVSGTVSRYIPGANKTNNLLSVYLSKGNKVLQG